MAKRVRPAATPAGDAYEAAVHYLAGRPHTVAEIHRHLRSKKFEVETIDHAIDRLRAQRYVDDEAFARWWVEQRERFKPRGDRALRTELAQKGVARKWAGKRNLGDAIFCTACRAKHPAN